MSRGRGQSRFKFVHPFHASFLFWEEHPTVAGLIDGAEELSGGLRYWR